MNELIHVVPLNDLRDHEASITCWCHPTPDEDEPAGYPASRPRPAREV